MKATYWGFSWLALSILLGSPSRADQIQAYFNHRADHSYRDPYYGRDRTGDDLEAVILGGVESAARTLDLAVYELDLPRVARALAKKQAAGVRVRIMLENKHSHLWRQLTPEERAKLNEHDRAKYDEFVNFADENRDGVMSPEEAQSHDSLAILQRGGVKWLDDTSDGSKGSGLMHHKFMVVDGKAVITGSANFTRSCTHGDSNKARSIGNANALLHIESAPLARLFTQEFELMWVNHQFGLKKTYRGPYALKIGPTPVTIQFSPTSKRLGWDASTNALIARQFKTATKSADLALFVFSDQSIANAMEEAHGRGMKPSVLIDPSFATRYYSELLDIFGLQMLNPKCAFEAGNRPWARPVMDSGFTVLDDGDVLHHKFAVVDGERAIVGSHNWSAAANEQNDEALLVIESRELSQAYTEEFEGLRKRAILGPQPWLYRKIAEAQAKCHAVLPRAR